MKERQQKLIDLLEKEGLMDKEKKLGCLFSIHQDGDDYQNDHNVICKSHQYMGDNDNFVNLHNSKIIGQYHLGSILQLFNSYYDWYLDENRLAITIETDTGREIYSIILNTTKPPMEWSEEQNKELVEFIEKIK